MAQHEMWGPEAGAAVLAATPPEERLILPVLQRLQRAFGFVPEGAIAMVAEALNVSRAEVVGVLTFYSDLRTSPPPARVLRVCVAEACRSVGAAELVRDLSANGVDFEEVYCLGNCALGPAAQIDGRLVGRCEAAALRGVTA